MIFGRCGWKITKLEFNVVSLTNYVFELPNSLSFTSNPFSLSLTTLPQSLIHNPLSHYWLSITHYPLSNTHQGDYFHSEPSNPSKMDNYWMIMECSQSAILKWSYSNKNCETHQLGLNHVCVILHLRQVLDTEKTIWQMCSLLVLETQSVYAPKIHLKLFLEQKFCLSFFEIQNI